MCDTVQIKQFVYGITARLSCLPAPQCSSVAEQLLLCIYKPLCFTSLVCCYSSRPDQENYPQHCELPDYVIVALLKREALLNEVRAHTVKIQKLFEMERMNSLQTKQLQVHAIACL